VEAVSAQPWPSRKLDHVHERLRAASMAVAAAVEGHFVDIRKWM